MVFHCKAYSAQHKKWVYGYPVLFIWHWFVYTREGICFIEENDVGGICACTGVMDLEGKEIYTNDIVQHADGWRGVVKFSRGNFWIYEIAGKDSGEEKIWPINTPCRVIGNVFDNKDLFK